MTLIYWRERYTNSKWACDKERNDLPTSDENTPKILEGQFEALSETDRSSRNLGCKFLFSGSWWILVDLDVDLGGS